MVALRYATQQFRTQGVLKMRYVGIVGAPSIDVVDAKLVAASEPVIYDGIIDISHVILLQFLGLVSARFWNC